MPTINAVVSGPDANSYLTLEEADERIDEFSQADKWDELDPDDRKRLLLRATRLVDQHKSWPPRQGATQRLAFPTTKDPAGVIPREVTTAVLETVDFLLDGSMTSLKRLQAEGVTSASILGQSSSFEAERSELPAAARRELDRIWARYQTPIGQGRSYDGSDDPDGESLFG